VVLTPEQGEDSQSQSCITFNRPYRLTREELDWQKERAEELWYNKAACKKIAATRGWQVETIEVLAGQRWLGIYGPKLFYLYSTGYKERLRPLDPVKAINLDGEKPFKNSTYCMQSLWRDDCLTEGNDKIVNITEGETDCISGWDKGIEGVWLALPNATTWRNHWRDSLIGKRIVLWPDNDPAGWRCADRVIEALEPVALSVEVKQKQW